MRVVDGSAVDVGLKDDVGNGVGVETCFTTGAPEMGTIVGTNVGVGCAVGSAERERCAAPMAFLHASSSPSTLKPYVFIRASSIVAPSRRDVSRSVILDSP